MRIEKVQNLTEDLKPVICDMYLQLQIAEHEFEKARSITFTQAEILYNNLAKNLKEDSTFEYYLAYVESEIVGFIEFGSEENIEDGGKKYLRINSIFVYPSHRRKGYGMQLLEFARSRGKELGYTQIGLGVLYENKPAHNLYLKSGFRNYGIEMMGDI